jgi:mercuric ion binding protein
MKQLLLVLICLLGFCICTFASNKKNTITIATQISCDHCLQCKSCGQHINDKIRDLERGIKKVKIQPKENTITVTYSTEKTNPEAIRKAITMAGFDADELKADHTAYKKLDACCRK